MNEPELDEVFYIGIWKWYVTGELPRKAEDLGWFSPVKGAMEGEDE